MPLTSFVEDNGPRSLQTDGSGLYFRTLNGVFSLPIAGGEPTMLFDATTLTGIEPTVSEMVMRASDLVIVMSTSQDKGPRLVPKAVGASSALPPWGARIPNIGLLATAMVVEGDTLYGVDEEGKFDEPKTLHYFKHDLPTGTQTEIAAINDDPKLSSSPSMAKLGDTLLVEQSTSGGGRVGRLSLTGQFEVIDTMTPMGSVSLLGASGSDAYLRVCQKDKAAPCELRRLPGGKGPGEPVTMPDKLYSFDSPSFASDAAGVTFISAGNKNVYYSAAGSSAFAKAGCIGGKLNHFGIAVSGKTIYVAVTDGTKGGIVRFAAP